MTGAVDLEREVEHARALGASPAEALVVIERVLAEDLLSHGVATAVCVMAARWGVEPADAIAELVGGRRVGGEVSDYELRAANAEAADEVLAPSSRGSSTQSDADGLNAVQIDVIGRSEWHVGYESA